MEERREISVFYLYIQFNLFQLSTNGTIGYNKAENYLGRWRIPKYLRKAIIKDLIENELIQKPNKRTIYVNKPNINLTNARVIYRQNEFTPFKYRE